MKAHCERPYRNMIVAAETLRHLPENATEWHLRRLVTELVDAVFNLDSRMRAGLTAPQAWQVFTPDAHQAQNPPNAPLPENDRSEKNPDEPKTDDAPLSYGLPAAPPEEGRNTDDG